VRILAQTSWAKSASKVEAIDPTSNFWWLDDAATEAECHRLRIHRREDRLVEVWADTDPGALLHAQSRLTAALA
jgi:hypothetical protein